MKDLYEKFKQLTGVSNIGISNVLGCTRQNVSLMFNAKTKVSKAALAFAMNEIINDRIGALEQNIKKLKELKESIVQDCKNT